MNAITLKSSILQLAVQGKLVSQNPLDEPSSAFITRIQKEKDGLIKSGKLKRERELAPITEDDIPYSLPEGWSWIRLGDYCERITDQVASGSFASLRENVKSLKVPSYAIMVKTADFANGFTNNLTYTDEHGYHFLENSNLFGGELILSNIGSIGKVFIVPHLDSPMTLAPNSVMVRLMSDAQRDYLYWFLLSPQGYDELMEITSGTAMKKFNKTDLKTILVPVPPINEQTRIVAKINQLLPIIDEYGKCQEELDSLNKILPDKLRKSVLQEAIHGTLVSNDIPEGEATGAELLQQILKERQDRENKEKGKKAKKLTLSTIEEEPWELPEGWCWCKLSDLFNIVSARRVHQSDWRTSGIPFYRTREIGWLAENRTDVKPELYIEESLYERFKQSGYPSPGDIMMTAVGTVGKTYIVQPEDKFYYKDASVLCLENISKVNPKYICYVIASDFFKSMIAEEAMGTTVATITMVRANEYIVPLPPLSIQHRIVEKIEEVFSAISNL